MEYFFGLTGKLDFFAPIYYLVNPSQRIFIPYLLTSFLIAILIFFWQVRHEKRSADPSAKLVRFIFPREMYLHRSAIVDYFYFYVNAVLYTVIIAPFMMLFSVTSVHVSSALMQHLGTPESALVPDSWANLLFTLCVILALDFGIFITHYLQHRIPVLWQFHKVHHSAEVLTPISVYRMHPIDDIFSIAVTSIFTGVVYGAFKYFFTPQISMFLVYNVNIILFGFYVFAYHLRHSHIWLSYGPYLSYLLISPAQHQIHHSKASRHWDKNYGFIFSFWDWAFKSLYVPQGHEKLEFGMGNNEELEFSTVLRLYFVPFLKAWRIICRK